MADKLAKVLPFKKPSTQQEAPMQKDDAASDKVENAIKKLRAVHASFEVVLVQLQGLCTDTDTEQSTILESLTRDQFLDIQMCGEILSPSAHIETSKEDLDTLSDSLMEITTIFEGHIKKLEKVLIAQQQAQAERDRLAAEARQKAEADAKAEAEHQRLAEETREKERARVEVLKKAEQDRQAAVTLAKAMADAKVERADAINALKQARTLLLDAIKSNGGNPDELRALTPLYCQRYGVPFEGQDGFRTYVTYAKQADAGMLATDMPPREMRVAAAALTKIATAINSAVAKKEQDQNVKDEKNKLGATLNSPAANLKLATAKDVTDDPKEQQFFSGNGTADTGSKPSPYTLAAKKAVETIANLETYTSKLVGTEGSLSDRLLRAMNMVKGAHSTLKEWIFYENALKVLQSADINANGDPILIVAALSDIDFLIRKMEERETESRRMATSATLLAPSSKPKPPPPPLPPLPRPRRTVLSTDPQDAVAPAPPSNPAPNSSDAEDSKARVEENELSKKPPSASKARMWLKENWIQMGITLLAGFILGNMTMFLIKQQTNEPHPIAKAHPSAKISSEPSAQVVMSAMGTQVQVTTSVTVTTTAAPAPAKKSHQPMSKENLDIVNLARSTNGDPTCWHSPEVELPPVKPYVDCGKDGAQSKLLKDTYGNECLNVERCTVFFP
ncbi:MAG: hypothetical protein ABIO72_05025 [Patescibacteria group bacterium]